MINNMNLKNLIFACICLSSVQLFSQSDSTFAEGFENYPLDSGLVINGSRGEDKIVTGRLGFPVSWDETYKYWSGGWALSKKLDGSDGPSSAEKYLYTARPGFGAEKTGKAFLVGQNNSWLKLSELNRPDEWPLYGFYVSNSNYTYNSMKRGDMFAKKFGGSEGTDPDSLLLIIRFWNNGLFRDSGIVYLADYRSADSAKDYLLDSWQFVSMAGLNNVDSVTFQMVSSDNGAWGMNTPAFFVADKFVFLVTLNLEATVKNAAEVFPVPAESVLNVRAESTLLELTLLNLNGAVMIKQAGEHGNEVKMDLQSIPAGVYNLIIQTTSGFESLKILKAP